MDKAPDAFRTISEVAEELEVPQHVLRFWETRFSQIKPMKRSGGRRYYRPDDVDLLRGIRRLLYGEGYTIRGVQRILKAHGIKSVQSLTENAAVVFGPIERGSSARARNADDDRAGEMNDAADDAGEEIGDDFDEAAGDDEAAEEGVPPQRREPELSAPRRVEPAMRFEPEPSARPTAGHPDTPSPSAEFRRLDTDRLRAVLTELTACRQLLEAALKEG
ncbi:MAG: MerR family transcriptional regulator [Rhizobiales bacterium]|nr:MerR family transcriptional regulator [Hyphomicrobiales bacterium]